jgi:thiol-disulfide isomerase/thioredoxin
MQANIHGILRRSGGSGRSGQAAEQRPFSDQAFSAAQDAGKAVLVQIHADWCPTCKAQVPILDRLSAQAPYSGIERLRVDFDSQKSLVKRFKASTQSTLILYKGRAELTRSVGETDESRIRAMLDKAR